MDNHTIRDINMRRINVIHEIRKLKALLVPLQMELADLNAKAHEAKEQQKEEHNANYDRQTALYGRAPGRRWK